MTGASGFIGANLAQKLGKENYIISVLSRELPDKKAKTGNVIFLKGDILDIIKLKPFFSGIDTVFHCAAYISFGREDFKKAYQVNVEGTKNVLEAAYQAGAKKVVHLSACAVMGFSSDKNRILDENANPEIKKDNTYAYTKKLAEEEVQKYIRKGLNVSIASISTVYGPGDNKLNSGAIIKLIYEEKLKIVPPGGTSFVSVDDLVDGLILLAEKGKPGERYIFCTENMEYKVLVQRIARTLKVKEPRYALPGFTYYPALCAVKGIMLFSGFGKGKINLMTPQILKETYGYKYFSSKKAKEELGWSPSQSFEEAVGNAFKYYKENQLI